MCSNEAACTNYHYVWNKKKQRPKRTQITHWRKYLNKALLYVSMGAQAAHKAHTQYFYCDFMQSI